MLLFALSFQEQVEKYGVYVGIAAFFGLAVLSLLYFSQARELKRLREWAERAPERARELEQHVVSRATAAAARRPPAMPGATGPMTPPRRLAEMPAPAAQPAATAQATELADAVPAEDEPATNGNVPAAPAPAAGAAAAAGANGAAPPAEDEAKEAEEKEPVEADGSPSGEGEDAAAEPEVAAAEPDDVKAAEQEEKQADAEPEPEPEPVAETTTPATRPGEVPAAVPRATPAQRVGVAPREPAAMPLRQTRPSATPKGPPRRPGPPQQRRPAGAPREGRSAGTIALFVGLAVLILGGGVFLVSQLGGEDPPPAPNRAAPPPTQTEAGGDGGGGGGGGQSSTPPAETNVAVLNGTTFTGLAGQLADRVSQEGGYERGVVETNTRDQTLETSTVFYADGFRQAARSVAELLSVSRIEPLDEDTAALAPDADVVLLAGADQAP